MWETIQQWSNINEGWVAVIIFLIATFVITPIAFLLKRIFEKGKANRMSQKQEAGDNSANYQAGRDININKQ